MRRIPTVAVLAFAAATLATAVACTAPTASDTRRPTTVHRDDDPTPPPSDTSKKCGMIGSGTC